jgi:dTMP kinase
MAGKLIVIEGADGTGKTTQVRLLADRIKKELGIDCMTTREPGGSPNAEDIRSFIFKEREQELNHVTDLFLMLAARREHIMTTVLPALLEDRWVICDRFSLSTQVYNIRAIRSITADKHPQLLLSAGTILPGETFTILLDAPITVLRDRLVSRQNTDRFEIDIAAKLGAYKELISDYYPSTKVDSRGSIEEVHELIYEQVIKFNNNEFSS